MVSDDEKIHSMVTAQGLVIPDYAKTSSLHVSESWHEAVDSAEAFVAASKSTGVLEHLRNK